MAFWLFNSGSIHSILLRRSTEQSALLDVIKGYGFDPNIEIMANKVHDVLLRSSLLL